MLAGCLQVGVCAAQTAPAAPSPPKKDTVAESDAAEAKAAAQDEILVTGHRQHGAVVTDVPAEVTLNAAVVQSLGAADLTEVFRELAPEIGALPATSGAQTGPTIVLVNGQRIAGFGSIKDFPPESVRRIEIFPEQVALQYGYDAGQRVVNVVLRQDYHALTLLGRYTAAPDNDWRGVYRGKIDLLRIGGDSHWNLALDYSHQDPIYADTTLVGPPSPANPGSVPQHTLAAQDDHLTVSGAVTRLIGSVSAELTGSLDLDALESRPGLLAEDGDILAADGLSDLVSGPYARVDRTVRAQTNLTLNGKLDSWRWSFIGRLDESTRETRTEGAFTANDSMESVLLPSPAVLDNECSRGLNPDCVATTQRSAGGDVYLNGNLFALPAGKVTAALRGGFELADVRGSSLGQSKEFDRNQGSFRGNLDLPITRRASAIGKLTLGVNGEIDRLSDFGTIDTIGTTLTWSPIEAIDILGSYSRAEQAPTLLQLGQATLVTPDLREFDFVSGTTTIISRAESGNGALTPQTSHVTRVRVQVTPLASPNLTLSAEYTSDHAYNPIVNISAATTATIAAFPDRFARRNGYLTALDAGPANLAWRDTQQVRYGVNYTLTFGRPWRAPNGEIVGSDVHPARNQFQIALYDTWTLQDQLVLRSGGSRLDLLNGDIVSDLGGTARHRVELQTSLASHPYSVDVSASWQTPTTADIPGDRLTFSQGVSFNLRFQLNLADQHWLTRWIPSLRGSLNISADNLFGAHTRVHDANGGVPAAYAVSYLNPTGRTFRITLRKRFRS